MKQVKREYFFDNARVLLIFLVVFGHVIQSSTADSKVVMALYQTIYLFHMPAMIFVSGFFAKGKWDINYFKNLLKKLMIPYLIFQLIHNGFNYWHGQSMKGIMEPNWSLWFLLSLYRSPAQRTRYFSDVVNQRLGRPALYSVSWLSI